MNYVDEQYFALLERILTEGGFRPNRTGIPSKEIFKHDMKFDLRKGFPLLTSRFVPIKSSQWETKGFCEGITDKRWYQERGCGFWDHWCNPQKVPYGTDPETIEAMRDENDLGVIYGAQWRNFSDPEACQLEQDGEHEEGCKTVKCKIVEPRGVDQLASLVENLRAGKDNRRLIVQAWNPLALKHMALVPCHYEFVCHISPCGKYLDLDWSQRSVDVPIGLPNNIASYALLLELLARDAGLTPRYLHASLKNCHIYEDQIPKVKELLGRISDFKSPKIKFNTEETDFWKWSPDDIEIVDYEHMGRIKFPKPAV